MLEAYEKVTAEHRKESTQAVPDFWHRMLAELEVEWDLAVEKSATIRAAFKDEEDSEVPLD